MADSIDQLQIDITTQATKANDAIDKFIGKLDRLSISIEKIDASKITGLANSVNRLHSSMQGMNNIKTSDFTRLANNIDKISKINVAALNSAASSMSHLTRSFGGLETVSANAQAVGDMAKNIAKLGNKSVQTAITNMPRLAIAMNDLMTTLSKSPQVSNNLIQMTNALATFVNQGNKINSAVNSITNGLNRTNTAVVKTTKGSFSLSSAIGRFYQSYFYIKRAVDGIYSSITDTSDYIEGFNYYTVAFEKIASEWDSQFENYGSENAQKYTNAFVTQMNKELGKLSGLKLNLSADMESGTLLSSGEKNLALNLQEVTQYASQLASITNSVGQNGTISTTASSVFTKLAGDMSSLFNVDYSSVAKNLQSGLIGQSRALYKYGIDITNATLQTYAYELGLEKAVAEMTQAEKMQLRMIAILDQSEVAWGDLADTINTPANMLRQWTNNLEEASMMLGQLFMPLLENVLPILNGTTIAFKNFLSNVAGFMGVKIDLSSVGTGTSDVLEELEDVTGGYEDATAAAQEYKNQLLDFDEITKLQDTDTSLLSASSGSSIDLTNDILDAASKYEKIWEEAYKNMENKAQKFAEKFASAFKPIEKIIQDFAIGDYFQAGQDVSNLVVSINEFFTRAIDEIDEEQIGTNIGLFLEGLDWVKIADSFGDLFWTAINTGIEIWKNTFETAPIETTIITGLATLNFTGLGGIILSKLGTGLVKGLKSTFSFAFANPTTFAGMFAGTPAFDVIGSEILGEIEKKMDEMLPDWVNNLIGNIVAGISFGGITGFSLGNMPGSIAGAIIGGIIGALNGIEIDGESILLTLSKKLFNFDSASAWFDEAIKSFETAFDGKRQNWLDIGGYIFEGIVEGLIAGITYITEPFTDLFWWIWDGICEVFGINSPAEEMKPLGEWILKGICEGFVDAFSIIPTKAEDFFEEFSSNFTTEKFRKNIGSISSAISSKWNDALTYWKEKDGLSKISISTPDFLQTIKDAWSKVTSWWSNNKPSLSSLTLSMKLPHISITYDENAWNAGLFKALGFDGAPKFSVSYYAAGGFPEDGWFRASHGEIMGQFDNGKSVVANNMQITEGIANAVYPAVYDAMMAALAQGGGNSGGDVVVKIGEKEVFRAVKRQADNYTRQTGQPAFNF